MQKRNMILVGSASLALVLSRFALADNNNPAAPVPNQTQPVHAGLNFTLPRMEEKLPGNATHGGNGPVMQQGKPATQEEPHTGLHWTNVDSHPGVGYRLDKNEDVRVHLGGHGANASFALHF